MELLILSQRIIRRQHRILKEMKSGNFMKAWGGIASLQFALPALWTAAKERNVSVLDMAKWLSENPAKLIGREHNKGKIAAGYDADIIVWDDEKEFVVAEEMILHKNKVTPYLDKTLRGVIEQTYLGGIEVYKNGNFSALNKGKFIIRTS